MGNAGVIDSRPFRIMGLFETSIEEPWVAVIHTALEKIASEKNTIEYKHKDKIDPSKIADFAKNAANDKYDLIIGDSFRAEIKLRQVASKFSRTKGEGAAFVFGSALGPSRNFSVFDNWVHEPAFLAGMIASSITNKRIGIVAGKPIPEINRIVNAFILGTTEESILEGNPSPQVDVAFIEDFHDPSLAAEAARKLISAGAELIFSEREGAIPVCQKLGIPVIGHLMAQNEESPEKVVTSVVWKMEPTIKRVIARLRNGTHVPEDYGSYSLMYKEGSDLQYPLSQKWQNRIGATKLTHIRRHYSSVLRGEHRVPVIEIDPRNYLLKYAASNFEDAPVNIATAGDSLLGPSDEE